MKTIAFFLLISLLLRCVHAGLTYTIQPQMSGYTDMIDTPVAPNRPLRLLDLGGAPVAPLEQNAGKVLVLVGVSLNNPLWAGEDARCARRLAALRDALAGKPVVVIPVAFEGEDGNLQTPSEFAAAHGFGNLLREPARDGLAGYSELRPRRLQVPAVVIDGEGRMVYRVCASVLPAEALSLLVGRLLDAEFESSIRREFPDKDRALPIVQDVPGGVLCRDDFESYADSTDLRLHPRWGFRYETQARVDLRGGIAKGGGAGATNALLLDHTDFAPDISNMLLCNTHRHDFAVDVEEGHVRFRFRRNGPVPQRADVAEWPVTKEGGVYYFDHASFSFSFYRKDGTFPAVRADFAGPPGGEVLVVNRASAHEFRPSEERWHECLLEVTGSKAVLKLDSQPLGEYDADGISGLGFQTSWLTSFCVDDVEVFVAGDPEQIRRQQAGRRYTSNREAARGTVEQTRRMFLEPIPQVMGKRPVPVGTVPRPNVTGFRGALICFDEPIVPQGDLILESVDEPGRMINLTELLSGQPVFMYPSGAFDYGDYFGRSLEQKASPLAFDCRKRLVDEYAPKGVAFVAVASDNRHYHILPCLSYEERREVAIGQKLWRRTPGYSPRSPMPQELQVMDTNRGDYLLWARKNPAFGLKIGTRMSIIMDGKGRILLRDRPGDDYPYYGHKVLLERFTNAQFDRRVRAGFPDTPRALPTVEKRADGTLYRDDFESYPDSFAFRTHPSWGFEYESQGTMEYRMDVVARSGVEGTRALCLNQLFTADCLVGRTYNVVEPHHLLPQVLKRGYMQFRLRQGPYSWFLAGNKQRESGNILLEDSRGQAACIQVKGSKGAEHVGIKGGRSHSVALGDATWQTVKITFPGRGRARVAVDGEDLGELDVQDLKRVRLHNPATTECVYLDDFEYLVQ